MLLAEASFFETYGMIIILAIFFVVMIVMTIIPQRKQKKQQQQMMDSLGPGAKIMTIGGFVGTIVKVDGDNILVDIGTKDDPQVVVIVRNAVRQRLDAVPVAPVKKEEEKKNDGEYSIPQPTEAQIEEMQAKEKAEEVEAPVDAEPVQEEVVSEEAPAVEEKPVAEEAPVAEEKPKKARKSTKKSDK